MHLTEILAQRTVPAAGLTIGVTRRCPLHCAHCSTSSTMSSEQLPANLLERFVGTFAVDDHPTLLAMSGGEAMLRPRLVRRLAEAVRAVGTRSMALSGLFFATGAGIPAPIRDAIGALDHFSVSIDAFHEREVPRANVLAVLEELLADGVDLSVHVCGRDADDPYLAEATDEIYRAFDGRVPMFVNCVSAFGRAKDWFPARSASPTGAAPNPCGSAAWPLVAFDGSVVACGNDNIVIGHTPDHLRLGHIAEDDWPTIRSRCLRSPMLRAIRLFGPRHLADRFTGGDTGDYCGTCVALPAGVGAEVEALMARPGTAVMAETVAAMQVSAGAVSFARRHGVPRYAELVTCGAPR